MNVELWTVIGLLLTNASLLFGMWKYFDSRIEKKDKEHDAKVSKIWTRFDEHKDHIEALYVRKDNCGLLHRNTADNLAGLETRIEKRFDKLDDQINKLLNK